MGGKEENNGPKISLPPLPGTYAPMRTFSNRLEIVVGRLGHT